MSFKDCKMKSYIIALLSMCVSVVGFSQSASTQKNYLLMDVELQIESLEGLQALYNFDFATAQQNFSTLKKKYPEHPIAYYLLGLMEWWKIVPNSDVKSYDEKLIAYMDSSIIFSKKMYDKDKHNIEANFFWRLLMVLKEEYILTEPIGVRLL